MKTWLKLKKLYLATVFLVVLIGTASEAAPYADMVIDARTGEVLRSRNADTRLHPASLTKMMTLYKAFEAIENGEIDVDKKITISRHAANERPSKQCTRCKQHRCLPSEQQERLATQSHLNCAEMGLECTMYECSLCSTQVPEIHAKVEYIGKKAVRKEYLSPTVTCNRCMHLSASNQKVQNEAKARRAKSGAAVNFSTKCRDRYAWSGTFLSNGHTMFIHYVQFPVGGGAPWPGQSSSSSCCWCCRWWW